MFETVIAIVTKYVAPLLGVVGGLLGIAGFWRTVSRDRMKLRVTPVDARPVGAMELMYPHLRFGIEVVNLSSFPVVVEEVGFTLKGTQRRGAVISPISSKGSSTPFKLEARDSVSFYMQRPDTRTQITHAYARTACGRIFQGTSPALRDMDAMNRGLSTRH